MQTRHWIPRTEHVGHFRHNPEIPKLFRNNWTTYDNTLIKLGLASRSRKADSTAYATDLQGFKRIFLDRTLVEAHQYDELEVAALIPCEQLGPHMYEGIYGYARRNTEESVDEPRELTTRDFLRSFAGVMLESKVDSQNRFEPTLRACRDIGTIMLLENAQRVPAISSQ